MRFSWKNVRWGAAFSLFVLLLGFHSAIETSGEFWSAMAYGLMLGLLGIAFAWANGAQPQKTFAFWIGAIIVAMPLGYVMYTYKEELQLILTLAWLLVIILGITLMFREMWRRSGAKQPTT